MVAIWREKNIWFSRWNLFFGEKKTGLAVIFFMLIFQPNLFNNISLSLGYTFKPSINCQLAPHLLIHDHDSNVLYIDTTFPHLQSGKWLIFVSDHSYFLNQSFFCTYNYFVLSLLWRNSGETQTYFDCIKKYLVFVTSCNILSLHITVYIMYQMD